MPTYWIQNSDLSVYAEEDVDSAASIIAAYETHDWNTQIQQQLRLEKSGSDTCPAGLGVVRSEGVILHLIPNADHSTRGHWHTLRKKKVFGIFSKNISDVFEFSDLKPPFVKELIFNFVAGKDNWLVQNLPRKG